jgi:hypothetical protein
MTPRGLKLFLDTVDYSPDSFLLPDSINPKYLLPLPISMEERDSIPGIIAISLPGFWEETIFGVIGSNGRMRMLYKGRELQVSSIRDLSPGKGSWSGVFRNDSMEVKISAILSDTKIGDHLGGNGKLTILENHTLMEEEDVFVVFEKSFGQRGN